MTAANQIKQQMSNCSNIVKPNAVWHPKTCNPFQIQVLKRDKKIKEITIKISHNNVKMLQQTIQTQTMTT